MLNLQVSQPGLQDPNTRKTENANAFAALLNAIQASKQSKDLARAMQSLKEEQNKQGESS